MAPPGSSDRAPRIPVFEGWNPYGRDARWESQNAL
eukprot:gene33946-31256_t